MIDAAQALTPAGFGELLVEHLRSEITVYPVRAWQPSGLAHPCDRHVVWRFSKWELQQPHGPVLQSIFDQGKAIQPLIYDRLEKMGFEVVRESDRPTQYKLKNGALISGRPDGKIRGFRGERYPRAVLLEAKSMNGPQFDRVHTAEDIRTSKTVWTRIYYAQGQIYCLLEDLTQGVFVLYSKATGMLKLIPYDIDLEFLEPLLQRMERLQALMATDVEPEPISYDWSICGRCGFLPHCYPPVNFGDGASIIDDPEFVELLERRAELKPASKEYDEIDTGVKARLRHEGISLAIAGPFTIEGKEKHRKGYAVSEADYVEYRINRAKGAPKEGTSDGSNSNKG